MKLQELFKKVREDNLSREQIEAYRDQLSFLFADLQTELAEIRKAKAIYYIEQPEKTDVATGRKWAVTKEGQREIDLSHYIKGTEKILSSLKSRLYSTY